MLDVRLFGNRALASGSLNLFIVFAVMFGCSWCWCSSCRRCSGTARFGLGQGLLPMAALRAAVECRARASPSAPARPLLIGGTSVVAGGLVWMASMPTIDGGYLSVLPGLLLIGAGMGLVMTPSTVAITESLPAEKQGGVGAERHRARSGRRSASHCSARC
ncbi:MAG: hypothetical protein R2713_02865 [Ilumatobacteraceae bacterium]